MDDNPGFEASPDGWTRLNQRAVPHYVPRDLSWSGRCDICGAAIEPEQATLFAADYETGEGITVHVTCRNATTEDGQPAIVVSRRGSFIAYWGPADSDAAFVYVEGR